MALDQLYPEAALVRPALPAFAQDWDRPLAALNPIVNDTNPVNALLARFSFTALQVGSTVFGIDGSLPNPNFERGLIYAVGLPEEVGFAGEVMLNVERVTVPVPGTALLMAMGLGWPGSPGVAADESFTTAPAVVLDDLSLIYCLPLGTGTCRQMQYVDLRAGFR